MVQRTDIAGQRLESDGANLNVVLHRILNSRANLPDHVFKYVRNIYEGFDRFRLDILPSGYLQLVAQERDCDVPANRLSDGTIRFLCLLAVLLEPNPPALLCIDEPDLGLHPDLIQVLADLLVQASKRMQIIASTHNERLIDCLAGNPESILAFDREDGATVVKRLDAKELEPRLKKYSMSELWSRGQLGGTRW